MILVQELEQLIPEFTKSNKSVSKSNIAWHIDHALLTINNLCISLKRSKYESYSSEFNFFLVLFKLFGRIPRGIVKAPKSVQTMHEIHEKDLLRKSQKSTELLHDISLIAENSFVIHPILGNLRRQEAIHFLEVHTKHHISIIQDILNKR